MEQLLAHDEARDAVSLTGEGVLFMSRFVIYGDEPPPELPIGVLLVAAGLVKTYWGIEDVDVSDIVDSAAFNTDMPALEMPGATREIRRRLAEGLRRSERWQNIRSRLPSDEELAR